MAAEPIPEYLSAKSVQQILDCGRTHAYATIYDYAARGAEVIKQNTLVRINKTDFERLVQEQRI